jgi:hypothetical protein
MKVTTLFGSCSRRRLVFGLAALLLLPGIPAFAAKAEPSPKAFLEGIYKKYVGNSAKGARGIPLNNDAVIRRYFSADLARLMVEDNAQAKKKGEVPTLDGDAFVGHQEWEIKDLAIAVAQEGALKATGTVTFTNEGKPEKVVLALFNAGAGWRISDIQWADGSLRALYAKK